MTPTGTHINYYFICHRKLWFFSNHIFSEHNSDTVRLGKLLHEESYSGKRKEYQFGPVKVDWLDLKEKVIHEVKKSDKVENAHLWQLKYYLYYLRENGAGEFTGELNYPRLNKKQTVTLEDEDVQEIRRIIAEIEKIISAPKPPPIEVDKRICKSCSYFELCHI